MRSVVAVAPMHALPWYFGLTAFGIWAAAALGFTILFRRRLRARVQRRRDAERSHRGSDRAPRPAVRDDRSLGTGTDIERWT